MRPYRIRLAGAVLTSWTCPPWDRRAQTSLDVLVFDTYAPGPCSPTGTTRGCNPGELVRIAVRRVRAVWYSPALTCLPVRRPPCYRLPLRRAHRNGVLDSRRAGCRLLRSLAQPQRSCRTRASRNRTVSLTYGKGMTRRLARRRRSRCAAFRCKTLSRSSYLRAEAWVGLVALARIWPYCLLYFAVVFAKPEQQRRRQRCINSALTPTPARLRLPGGGRATLTNLRRQAGVEAGNLTTATAPAGFTWHPDTRECVHERRMLATVEPSIRAALGGRWSRLGDLQPQSLSDQPGWLHAWRCGSLGAGDQPLEHLSTPGIAFRWNGILHRRA